MYSGVSGVASSLGTNVEKVLDSSRVIDGISFSSIWNSAAGEVLINNLDSSLISLNDLVSDMNTFMEALSLTNEYIKIVEEIERLQSLLVNIVGDSDKANAARKDLEAQIAVLMEKKKALRMEIEGLLATIDSSITSKDTNINLSSSSDEFQYLIDPRELGKLLSGIHIAGDLSKNLPGGQEYVDEVLNKVLSDYSGREASVNYCLAAGLLSVEAGVLIPYENGGQNRVSIPYNNSKQLVNGMDCCSGVSLFVNAGTPNQQGFQWGHVGTFNKIARENDLYINIGDSLPGDVLVDHSDDFGHVSMILVNDTDNGMITIGQFGGNKDCFNIYTAPYSSFGEYNTVNMESYYNGDLVHKWSQE